MAAQYTQIIHSEMRDLLEPRGFKLIQLGDHVREIVYSRLYKLPVRDRELDISLRVYTSIHSSYGTSRERGTDAIRVACFWRKPSGEIIMLGGDRRVNRTQNWATNLNERLDNWQNEILTHWCPRCGSPMKMREPQKLSGKTWQPFWGCIRYPACVATKPVEV